MLGFSVSHNLTTSCQHTGLLTLPCDVPLSLRMSRQLKRMRVWLEAQARTQAGSPVAPPLASGSSWYDQYSQEHPEEIQQETQP